MKQLATKPKLSDDTGNCWPPLAHLVRNAGGKVKEGDKALCGAKLAGVPLDNATKVCKKCVKIAERIG